MSKKIPRDFSKPKATEIKPWSGVCSSRCYSAETDKKKCKCRCKGARHGKAHTEKASRLFEQ